MGFYLRKSLRVGPLRFNLSKSGIGVSAGIKGLRLGFGPRGNYVHAGANGFYYRTTLSPKESKRNGKPIIQESLNLKDSETTELREIESNMNLLFQDSSADELVREINRKNSMFYLWKWMLGACILGGIYLHPYVFVAALVLVPATYLWDETRKSVVLFYDFESESQVQFTKVIEAYEVMLASRKLWHVEAQGATKDWKINGGANTLVRRKDTSGSLKPPRFLKVNIPVATIGVGKQVLCFLPDKVLIVAKNSVAAISYVDLQVEVSSSRFIESGSVPGDAEVVDKTWMYVNKKGGPDKRFKDNRELPVCLYEDFQLSSSSGLNEQLQLSKRGSSGGFKDCIVGLAKRAA